MPNSNTPTTATTDARPFAPGALLRVAVASGKGGTGKTTVAANLAAMLAAAGERIALADCDVEEPNAHIFLDPEWHEEHPVTLPVPVVDTDVCLGESCRLCVDQCRFRALAWMGEVMVFNEMCHGCGLCTTICPAKAITESTRDLGRARTGTARAHGAILQVHDGVMRVGEAMAPPVIRAVKERVGSKDAKSDTGPEIVIVDCPPGASCPAMTASEDVDVILLVAEPTPFGVHDLSLVAEAMQAQGVPLAAVVNRHGLGDDTVFDFLKQAGIPLIGTIPYSREIAHICSEGRLIADERGDLAGRLASLWRKLQEVAAQ